MCVVRTSAPSDRSNDSGDNSAVPPSRTNRSPAILSAPFLSVVAVHSRALVASTVARLEVTRLPVPRSRLSARRRLFAESTRPLPEWSACTMDRGCGRSRNAVLSGRLRPESTNWKDSWMKSVAKRAIAARSGAVPRFGSTASITAERRRRAATLGGWGASGSAANNSGKRWKIARSTEWRTTVALGWRPPEAGS